jgi:hypothetical protein
MPHHYFPPSGHLPAGAVAYCVLCKQPFRNEYTYFRHRDMNVPTYRRICKTPAEASGFTSNRKPS